MFDRQPLREFVQWAQSHLRGDEKGEAQIFLDHLFQALGYPDGLKDAQGTLEHRVSLPNEIARLTTHYIDLYLPDRAIIEMKRRGEDLTLHQQQATSYWTYTVPRVPYVILCNFDEFWVYDMNRQPSYPMGKVKLAELVDNFGPLSFLLPTPAAPVFNSEFDLVDITDQAARSLAELYRLLTAAARDIPPEYAQRFILQCMIALFSEDIDLIEPYLFTRLIDECLSPPARPEDVPATSDDLFTMLFFMMNYPGQKYGGRFHRVPYFNGGIFAQIHPLHLVRSELLVLREAARHNWAKIRPAIFGNIFEYSMEAGARHRIGAYYTSEVDILRIVEPVIIRPWNSRIVHAAPDQLRALHAELCAYIVLDPACGSGNFLYVAYREMKKLEQQIVRRLRESGDDAPLDGFVSARQFYGFDVSPFAVELARVTLMIAKKLAADELNTGEAPLPLDSLDGNIRVADALFEEWVEFDACIGNPPYLGAKRLKQEYPPAYINRVRAAFPDVPGNADYCVYWFRKAHAHMKPGGRAGLVATNTIRQNYSRQGSLDYIAANGGTIYEAVPTMPWSGSANVHVSIVCWAQGAAPDDGARLWVDEGRRALPVAHIPPTLTAQTDVRSARLLRANTEPKRVFQGQTPGHSGFVLSRSEADRLVAGKPRNHEVIFPYLIGDDLIGQPFAQPSRYVIDFERRDLQAAAAYPEVFNRVRVLVLPERERKAAAEQHKNEAVLSGGSGSVNLHHQHALDQWWLHFYGRSDRAEAVRGLRRYIACSRVSKRHIFEFVSTAIKPGDSLQTFAFDDDYTFAILQARLHWLWWLERGATLKSDPAYTPHSIFDTFPFPQEPDFALVRAAAEAGRALHEFRRARLRTDGRLTLRALYRTLDLPGKSPLRELHERLDQAVLAVYGFDAEGDPLAQLLTLNLTTAAREAAGEAVTPPGVPPGFPDPAALVSEGCIQPPEW